MRNPVSIFARQVANISLPPVVVLFFMVLLAGAVRGYNLHDPGLLVSREFTSAVIARDYFFQGKDEISTEVRDITRVTRENQPILEPPITEFLVSLSYRLRGTEDLRLARGLTSTFWLLGGIFLFRIASRIGSPLAALCATGYYLFAPLSILLSRSFQPDALMMLALLISLDLVLRYYDRPTLPAGILAMVVSGLSILYRPLILFIILGAFTALAIHHEQSWKAVLRGRFLRFTGIMLLPAALYYGYGLAITDHFQLNVEASFAPRLLRNRAFWEGWLQLAVWAAGLPAIIAGLLGFSLMSPGRTRALLIGLATGYGVFGSVFTMPIHTHDYFHGQLIPIVALAFIPLIDIIREYLTQRKTNGHRWMPLAGIAAVWIFLSLSEVRDLLGG